MRRRTRCATLTVILAALCASATPRPGTAQTAPVVDGFIRDSSGAPIAFAQIRGPGVDPRVSDDFGRFRVSMRKAGPLSLQIRRVGFRPLDLRITVSSDTTLILVMAPFAASLKTVRIESEATVQSLEFHGFYDRLRDRIKGTATGTFIMPEEIEGRRGALKASQLLQGMPNVRVMRRRASCPGPGGMCVKWYDTLVGPGGCPMTIYVDGVRLNSMTVGMAAFVDLEDVPQTPELAGVEVYTHAHVPPQFGAFALNCGVVLFWTK